MLKVSNLGVTYRTDQGVVDAVRGVSLTVERGQFYTLLGPSGCGKTSTLRAIAGLESPNCGTIEIGSRCVYSGAANINIPVYERGIGMVFQNYAIWPHMTVSENVAFPLVHGGHKVPHAQVREKVMKALSLVQLDGLADRPSPLLSGGQQQRVALARAIVHEPDVLLLDEPLSNLDAKLREEMRYELKRLIRRLEMTTLYVTHDQLEALTMSDTVALMQNGLIVQEGPPRAVYLAPANAFAANFLGRSNLVEGRVSSSASPERGVGLVETDWGTITCQLPEVVREDARVTLGFRPESVILSAKTPSDASNSFQGTISAHAFAGDMVEYQVDVGQHTIRVKASPFELFAEGDQIHACIPPERWYLISVGEEAAAPVAAGA
jgi:iron(III) transport system ATP-binding protein